MQSNAACLYLGLALKIQRTNSSCYIAAHLIISVLLTLPQMCIQPV